MWQEFKEFALKGNMVDLAVGLVIGVAFGAVVASLVADIITPLIAAIFQAPDFSNLFVVLRNPTGTAFTSVESAREAGAVVLSYGTFVNVISFLIVAFALFIVVKGMNKLQRQKVAAAAEPAAPPHQRFSKHCLRRSAIYLEFRFNGSFCRLLSNCTNLQSD